MKHKRSREEWLGDVAASQRNVVFPDTAENEARFWRNILSGKGRLNAIQIIGFTLIGLMLVALFTSIVLDEFQLPHSKVTLQFLVSRFGGYAIPFVVMGLFLLLIKITSQRSR